MHGIIACSAVQQFRNPMDLPQAKKEFIIIVVILVLGVIS